MAALELGTQVFGPTPVDALERRTGAPARRLRCSFPRRAAMGKPHLAVGVHCEAKVLGLLAATSVTSRSTSSASRSTASLMGEHPRQLPNDLTGRPTG